MDEKLRARLKAQLTEELERCVEFADLTTQTLDLALSRRVRLITGYRMRASRIREQLRGFDGPAPKSDERRSK